MPDYHAPPPWGRSPSSSSHPLLAPSTARTGGCLRGEAAGKALWGSHLFWVRWTGAGEVHSYGVRARPAGVHRRPRGWETGLNTPGEDALIPVHTYESRAADMEFWDDFWGVIGWIFWATVFFAYLMALFAVISDLFRDRTLRSRPG